MAEYEGGAVFVKNDIDINMSGQSMYIYHPSEKEAADTRERSLGGRVGCSCSFVVEPARRHDCSIVLSMQKLDKPIIFAEVLDAVKEYWEKRRGVIKINTPDESLNIMVNSWLQYQTISSRIMGRCGYYQSGGAYGFRDQLEDALSLLWASPMVMRNMLVEFAGHQFLSKAMCSIGGTNRSRGVMDAHQG